MLIMAGLVWLGLYCSGWAGGVLTAVKFLFNVCVFFLVGGGDETNYYLL